MRSLLTLFTLSALLFAGCNGCNTSPDDPKGPSKPVKVKRAENVIMVSEDTLNHIAAQAMKYFQSMSEGRYEDYVEVVYPGVFFEDSLKIKTIEALKGYEEQGFMNVTNSQEIKHISPVVHEEDKTVCQVWLDIEHDVFIGESYSEAPETLEPMIRSQFGEGRYRYNPEAMKYEVSGLIKLYAISPKDSLHFTFLNEQYTQSRAVANILKYETLMEMKNFEADILQ